MARFRLGPAALGAAAFFCVAPGGIVGLAPYLVAVYGATVRR